MISRLGRGNRRKNRSHRSQSRSKNCRSRLKHMYGQYYVEEYKWFNIQDEGYDLFLFLFLAVEREEVQPAAVPNEEEGDCIEEGVVEQGKDQHCSHLANQYGQVAIATGAGQCASCKHGVECGGE
jgi:hypothetical protein